LGEVYDQVLEHFPGIDEYAKENFQIWSKKGPLPAMYHGTTLSAITGIKLRGLVPHQENNFADPANYGVLVPHFAAKHSLERTYFDTYDQNDPRNLRINDDYVKPTIPKENDPAVLLKVDMESLLSDRRILFKYLMTGKISDLLNIRREIRESHRNSFLSPGYDRVGNILSFFTIPSKYISVLATGDLATSDKIEEISLDEAYQRMLANRPE